MATTPRSAHPRLRRALGTLAAGSLALSPVAWAQQGSPQGVVQIAGGSGGAAIPGDFVGISYEHNMLLRDIDRLDGLTGLIGLYRLLGADLSVRIGGATSDRDLPPYTDSQLAGIAGFVRAVGSATPLIYGLNFRTGDPGEDAADARRLSKLLGDRVIFQIGNEPDIYGMPFDAYIARWRTLHDAVAQAVPGARFAGPDVAKVGDWPARFAGQAGRDVVMLTQHVYGAPSNADDSRVILKAWTKRIDVVGRNCLQAPQVAARALPCRITEGGSLNGGANRNTAASLGGAVYNLKTLSTLAATGWVGFNFHGDVRRTVFGGYHPTRLTAGGDYVAQPTFYAMWMFSRLQGGRMLRIAQSSLPRSASALAVAMPGGQRRVLMTNLSLAPLAVTVRMQGGGVQGETLTLTAPSFTATTVTINGQQIPANGRGGFAPPPVPVRADAAGFRLTVPASSATLLTVGR